MKEFQDLPGTKWFTTFKGKPITTDITPTFSILLRVMHKLFYDDLPYSDGPSMSQELLYFEPVRNDAGETMAHTTTEFQRRENDVAEALLEAARGFTDEQLIVLVMLTKVVFGTLVIEGVPGSGKTRLALWLVIAIMHSCYDDSKIRTHQQKEVSQEESDDEGHEGKLSDDGFETDEDEDVELAIQPSIQELVDAMPDSEEKPKQKEDEPMSKDKWDQFYDIPPLHCGPSKEQLTAIIDSLPEDYTDRMS